MTTTLQSPRPDIIAALSPGDRLEVRQDTTSPAVLAVTQVCRVAGAIVLPDMDALADCLAAGRRFVAVVLRVSRGAAEVRVQAG